MSILLSKHKMTPEERLYFDECIRKERERHDRDRRAGLYDPTYARVHITYSDSTTAVISPKCVKEV